MSSRDGGGSPRESPSNRPKTRSRAEPVLHCNRCSEGKFIVSRIQRPPVIVIVLHCDNRRCGQLRGYRILADEAGLAAMTGTTVDTIPCRDCGEPLDLTTTTSTDGLSAATTLHCPSCLIIVTTRFHNPVGGAE